MFISSIQSFNSSYIFYAGALDYERQIVHQLKILAIDRAKEGRVNTGTAAILVKVEDVEDQPPEFVRVTPVARIEENSPIGTSVLQGKYILYFVSTQHALNL